jgi:hypothetical protein
MRWGAVLALLLLIPSIVWSGETGKDTTINKSANSNYIGKAANEKWEIAVQSARGKLGKVDVYIDTGSAGDKPRRTIKPTDIVGGILGMMETSEDRYFLVVEVKIKNLQKKETQFSLDDLSLKCGSDSAKPGAYAAGNEAASPVSVPTSSMGEPSSFTFPLMTKNNIEFMVPPRGEEEFRFLFSVSRSAESLVLHFRDLRPISISRPTLPGSGGKLQH